MVYRGTSYVFEHVEDHARGFLSFEDRMYYFEWAFGVVWRWYEV
jgi:hypothetical protein